MAVQHLTPEGMLQPAPYHHVAVATGSRQVHVAGQVGGDPDRDDLTRQVAAALRSTARGLAAAGATFDDVVRLTFFVVGWEPTAMADFLAGIESVSDELAMPRPLPPASLIGVQALFAPGVLVEVEATAVLD